MKNFNNEIDIRGIQKRHQFIILVAFNIFFAVMFLFTINANAEEIASNQTLEINFGEVNEHHIINYTMPANGYVRFYIEPVSSTNKNGNVNYCVKQNYKKYEDKAVFFGEPAHTHYYAFAKGQIIELDINSSYYLMDWVNKCNVTAEFYSYSNFESENNNSKKEADVVKVKKTYKGLLMWNETDWFVFKAPKTKKYNISFLNDEDSETGFDIEIYNASGKKIFNKYAKTDTGWLKSGKIKMKKGKKYYIKISNSNSVYQAFYRLKIK